MLGSYFDYTAFALKLFTNFMEDSVVRLTGDFGGQIHRDKLCPFNSVISYGRVWRKDAGK